MFCRPLSQIHSLVLNLAQSQETSHSKQNYINAYSLFNKTLTDAAEQLENIYYTFILRPSLTSAIAFEETQQTITPYVVVIILYITQKKNQREAPLETPDQAS